MAAALLVDPEEQICKTFIVASQVSAAEFRKR